MWRAPRNNTKSGDKKIIETTKRLHDNAYKEARKKMGASQGYMFPNLYIALALLEQILSWKPAGRIQRIFVVLRLYYTCTTGANFEPEDG